MSTPSSPQSPTERTGSAAASLPSSSVSPPRRKPLLGALPGSVLRRLRESASTAVLRPDLPPPTLPTSPPVAVTTGDKVAPLLRVSPFGFGFLVAAGALLANFLYDNLFSLSGIILTVIVSLFLALGLNPIVEWLTGRLRLRRGFAVLLVALGAMAVVVLGSWALVPLVTEQVTLLITNAPGYVSGLRHNPTVARFDQRYQILDKLNKSVADPQLWSNTFGGVLGAGKLLAGTMMSLVIGLVLTLYFLAQLPQIKQVVYQLAPRSKRPRAQYLANEMFRRIGGYLSGMFVVMLCSAICSFTMMQFTGLSRYALALAFICGLLSGVPLVGPPLAMVIVAVIALSVSPLTSVIVLVYFLLYQQFEAYVLSPRVMQRSVNVPGPVVVVAAVAGGTLLGIVGALLAIPTAAALLLLYREVLIPALDRS